MPDVALAAPSWLAARSFFCARPNPADDSRHRSGAACVSECVHRTIYGLNEGHSLMGPRRVRRRTNVLRGHATEDSRV
jgi:hypothetical protein